MNVIEFVVDTFAQPLTETEPSVTIAYVPAAKAHGSHTCPSTICDCYYGLVG